MDTTNLAHTEKTKTKQLWSEDMADACVFIMENIEFKDVISNPEKQDEKSVADSSHSLRMTKRKNIQIRNTHINIGSGEEISIKGLAELIKQQVDFSGELVFNVDKPDGTMRKVTDVTKLNGLGWKHHVNLETGIEKIIEWYQKQ